MPLTEYQKKAIRDNPQLRICTIARFLNCDYDLVKLYRRYHKIQTDILYNGCGLPLGR